jgi:hypothetical protein
MLFDRSSSYLGTEWSSLFSFSWKEGSLCCQRCDCLCLCARLLTHAPTPSLARREVPYSPLVGSTLKLPLRVTDTANACNPRCLLPRSSAAGTLSSSFLLFSLHALPLLLYPNHSPQIKMAARRLLVPLSLCLATASAFLVVPPQVRREGRREG